MFLKTHFQKVLEIHIRGDHFPQTKEEGPLDRDVPLMIRAHEVCVVGVGGLG